MLDPAISGQLCLTLLHNLWLVTLLAVLAWMVDRLVGRRAVQRSYAIHVAALVVSVAALPALFWIVAARGVAPPTKMGITSVSITLPESTSEPASGVVAHAPTAPDIVPATETFPAMFVPIEAQDTDLAPTPLPMNVLNIQAPGYGPYLARWRRGEPIPPVAYAYLDPAWSVGSVIVDEKGNPVEGAQVHSSVRFKRRTGDTEDGVVGHTQTTDANGSWHFDCVPESSGEIWVEITHPDLMPNRRSLARAEFELEQDGKPSAEVILQQGLSVNGKVTDEAGSPIAGAVIRSRFSHDIRMTETDALGAYEIAGREPGPARIVVWAKGKALDMKEIRIQPDMEPVSFQMQPGGKVRIRVLDEIDKPVAKASITFQWWRGRYSYGVIEYVLEDTNENGVWEWNEAPLDEFQIGIGRPGGKGMTTQKLLARDDEYVFHPPPALVITGKVVDGVTKQPVKEFQAIPARMDSPSSIGYQSSVSRESKDNEGNVTLNFELKKGQDVAATILMPDGKPAAGAEVALGVAGSQIMVKNGSFTRQTFASRTTADKSGCFLYPAQGSDFQVVVTHPTGYAHIKGMPDSFPDTIQLEAWARVEGTFRIGQKTAGDVPLRIQVLGDGSFGKDVPSVSFYHEAKTGADGAYAFERVVPGKGRIGRDSVLTMNDGSLEKKSSCMVAAEFPAGETLRLDLGGTGRAVIGKVEPLDGFTGKVPWNFAEVKVIVDVPRPEIPASLLEAPSDLDAREARWAEWQKTEEGKAWNAELEQYNRLRKPKPQFTATFGRDGTFRIDDVPADDYTLAVRFWFRHMGRLGHLRDYRFVVPETVDGTSTDPIDLGVLKLTPSR